MEYNHPSIPLCKAIIDQLKSSSALADKVGTRIYEAVPTNPTLPYVAIGSESYAREIWQHEAWIDLVVATEGRGRKTAKQIENLICGLLDYGLLTVEGFDVEEQELDGLQLLVEDNMASRASEMTFYFKLSAEEDILE